MMYEKSRRTRICQKKMSIFQCDYYTEIFDAETPDEIKGNR